MKTTTRRMLWMFGGVLVLVALLAFGFYLHIQKLIASAPRPGPQTVSATVAQELEWQPLLTAVGTVTAVRGVDISPELAGMVRSVEFKSGQEVKAGQVLVQMNADSDQAQLQSLQAAADLSASVLKRDQQQYDAEAISRAQLDNDAADLKSRRALVAQQQALFAKKTIRAPFAGKLGITTLNPGQYLNPGDKIVTLQTIDPIYVDFNLPQQQLGEVRIGQPVTVTTDGYPGVRFAGKVSAINAKVDTTTRTVMIQATLANPNRQLLPGMFANTSVEVGDLKRYLTLPQTAITYNPYGSTIYVIAPAGSASAAAPTPGASGVSAAASGSGAGATPAASAPASAASGGGLVAQQVFVTTGERRGDQVAILKGLEAGQRVITSGQLKLKNGTPVVVDNKVQPADSPNPTPQEK